MSLTRGRFVATTATLLAGTAAAAPLRAPAQSTVLEVAYAGSMTSLVEGPLKTAAGTALGVELHGHAQGASALAELIVGGSLQPDVFISVTPGPMRTVLKAGKAKEAVPVARTAMVIAYSQKSAVASDLGAADGSAGKTWWQILETANVRFGRTDPKTDPQGRNIIFVMQLAARHYHQPDLVARILGTEDNPAQIFEEPTVEARLQSGELDAASAYRLQPAAFGLPYVTLPPEIDLSNDALASQYAKASLTIDGKTYHPEPLVYYAAALTGALHADTAAAFVRWLTGTDAQKLFRDGHYDPIGNAAALRA